MKKQNTILLIRNAAKQDFGGAETYQISLAKVLHKNGLDPIIVTRSTKLLTASKDNRLKTIRGWWWSKQNWNGLNNLLLPIYLGWQLILTVWYTLLIIKTKPLALHIQSKDDFIAGTIAGYITRSTVVWTDHMDLRYIVKNTSARFKNILGKIVLFSSKLCTSIILISENEYALVTSQLKYPNGFIKKVRIINNGVIDTLSKQKKKPRNDKKIHFCIASRLVTNKGVRETIMAFNEVQQKIGNKVALDIYGDGPERMEFEKIAAKNKDIHFYGHQDNALDKIYNSDVFILPSYQEGFSIALLEATMLGKAIIATDVDSNKEIITDKKTGLLIKARDPQSLADAMTTLVENNKLCDSISKNSRKKYTLNYNLEDIVTHKIIPLYMGA